MIASNIQSFLTNGNNDLGRMFVEKSHTKSFDFDGINTAKKGAFQNRIWNKCYIEDQEE